MTLTVGGRLNPTETALFLSRHPGSPWTIPPVHELEREEAALRRAVEKPAAPRLLQPHLTWQVQVGAEQPGGPTAIVSLEVRGHVVHQPRDGRGFRRALRPV